MEEKNASGSNLLGLDLFHAMYVIGLAFGIEQISTSLYKSFRAFSLTSASVGSMAGDLLLFGAILLVIVRFFWSTGNIKRAWEHADRQGSKRSEQFVIVHLPMLLIQGALVLFVCLAFAERIDTASEPIGVAVFLVVVTLWNTLWLVWLTRDRRSQQPEATWIRNNAIFVVLGGALVTVYYCDPSLAFPVQIAFAVVSLSSSIFDLWKTSEYYSSSMGR